VKRASQSKVIILKDYIIGQLKLPITYSSSFQQAYDHGYGHLWAALHHTMMDQSHASIEISFSCTSINVGICFLIPFLQKHISIKGAKTPLFSL
jgi:hypothetical protein